MTLEDNSDLTKDEQIGKKRLSKRVKDYQIMITFTDKDSRVVICSPNDYNCAARVHIEKDDEVNHSVIKLTISLMNRISKQLVKMFNVGTSESQSNQNRINKAVTLKETNVSILSFCGRLTQNTKICLQLVNCVMQGMGPLQGLQVY